MEVGIQQQIKYKESDGISSSPRHRVLISTAAVTVSNIVLTGEGGREGGREGGTGKMLRWISVAR